VYAAIVRYPIAYRRINITLPEDALRLVDRTAAKGDRSRFIAEAISHYAKVAKKAALRKRLREGAVRRAERDRALALEWFDLEQEVKPRRPR
jgi:CopG family transcriptional regulator / antitoxin EndoAI